MGGLHIFKYKCCCREGHCVGWVNTEAEINSSSIPLRNKSTGKQPKALLTRCQLSKPWQHDCNIPTSFKHHLDFLHLQKVSRAKVVLKCGQNNPKSTPKHYWNCARQTLHGVIHEVISVALQKAVISHLYKGQLWSRIVLAFNCMTLNVPYDTSAPLNT